jgi:hypothetical protein
VPSPITLLSLAGLPLLGSLDDSPLIFQQHHFLAGCATVDMKMQTPIISMEMQFPDIIKPQVDKSIWPKPQTIQIYSKYILWQSDNI